MKCSGCKGTVGSRLGLEYQPVSPPAASGLTEQCFRGRIWEIDEAQDPSAYTGRWRML